MPPTADFAWRHWDDESVLYEARSGQTHFLTAVAAEALLALQSRPYATGELVETLAQTFDLTVSDEFAQQIDALLHQFHDLGLIERATAPQ